MKKITVMLIKKLAISAVLSRCGIWDSDGHVCTGCIPGERYLPEGVVLKVKFGGVSVMVWGCFS